jgi:hypothetical protein
LPSLGVLDLKNYLFTLGDAVVEIDKRRMCCSSGIDGRHEALLVDWGSAP